MAWSSPPAESGPIVVDTPLVSWASYSQAANSVFSTKPPAAQSRSWAEPLRILLQKELTLTDVGELGRIILPKVSPLCPYVCLDLLHMNYSRIWNSGPDS
jgi:hypothetical protein